MISILKMIIKSTIASIRWGPLTEEEETIVWDSKLSQILKANYIQRTPQSPHTIVILK